MPSLPKCTNCGSWVIGGETDANGTFCSNVCRTYFLYPGFCDSCRMATTDVSSGGTFTFNGIGTALYGSAEVCPTCASVVKRLFFTILFIPIIPLGKYRVKYVTKKKFFSRKLRPHV